MKVFIKLALVFFFGGIFGGLLEIGYQVVTSDHIVLGGFLYGPFRPIYGTGFLIIYLLSRKISKNPFIIFFVSFLVCSIFEYSVSFFLEKIFNTTWWDYSNFYLNLNGRICIMVSLFWGLLGLVFIKLLIPIYDKLYDKLNKNVVSMFLVLASIAFFIDAFISNIVHLSAR